MRKFLNFFIYLFLGLPIGLFIGISNSGLLSRLLEVLLALLSVLLIFGSIFKLQIGSKEIILIKDEKINTPRMLVIIWSIFIGLILGVHFKWNLIEPYLTHKRINFMAAEGTLNKTNLFKPGIKKSYSYIDSVLFSEDTIVLDEFLLQRNLVFQEEKQYGIQTQLSRRNSK